MFLRCNLFRFWTIALSYPTFIILRGKIHLTDSQYMYLLYIFLLTSKFENNYMYILVTCSRGLCIFYAMLATCTFIPVWDTKESFYVFYVQMITCSLMYFILFLWRLTWSVWNSGFFVINENFRLLWEYKLHGLNGLTSNFKVVVVTRSNIPEMEALVVGSVYRTYRK